MPQNQEQKEALTPLEVAELLKITKNTVYELVKRGEIPAYRAGKKIRIDRADIEAYKNSTRQGIPRAKSRGEPGREPAPAYPCPDGEERARADERANRAVRPLRPYILCGQDSLLDSLARKIERGSGPEDAVLRSYLGSYDALIALYNDEVQIAGIHLWDGESGEYNAPYLRRLMPGTQAALFRLARRKAGFYVRSGNPRGIRGWEDLARRDLVLVNRERGSGTRVLLDEQLRRLGLRGSDLSGYDRECLNSLAAAGIVARGGADLAIGPESSASQAKGVEFIPLQDECYDIAVRKERLGSPFFERALAILRSREFKEENTMLLGYDLGETGRLVAET